MREIGRFKPCGLTVASTFSGAGGSCLGFRWAGFRHVYANEFVTAAQETYRANFPDVDLDTRDVRTVTAADVLARAGLRRGELDVFEGSPPCQAFSTAGLRHAGWGRDKDHGGGAKGGSEDLFFEYVRLLRGLEPRAFVAENVSGLVKGVAKGYFLDILAALEASGYVVECRVLDAQWLGVPQQRQRTIFVGVRKDLGLRPAFPRPLPYRYSIRDALPWIGAMRFTTGPRDGKWQPYNKTFDVEREPVNTLPTFPPYRPGEGWSMRDLPGAVGFAPATAARMRRRGARGRLDADAPSLSLQAAGIGGVAHHQVDVRAPSPPDGAFEFKRSAAARLKKGGFDVALPELDSPAPPVTRRGIGGAFMSEVLVRDPATPALPPDHLKRWLKLKPGEADPERFSLIRSDPEKPSGTITIGNNLAASITHPYEPRKFTIAELRRLGGFPDDFVLTGSFQDQWARVGNSVPPPMMRAVAEAVRDLLLSAPRARSKKGK